MIVEAPMRTRLALVLALALVSAPTAQAQSRGPLAVAPGATMTCIAVPISIPPAQTIRATDAGGGAVDLDIFVLSASATPALSVSRNGRDLAITMRVPDGSMSCTARARLTGVPPGTYDLHLRRPSITVDVATTTATVR
jgi:hypothetical protein